MEIAKPIREERISHRSFRRTSCAPYNLTMHPLDQLDRLMERPSVDPAAIERLVADAAADIMILWAASSSARSSDPMGILPAVRSLEWRRSPRLLPVGPCDALIGRSQDQKSRHRQPAGA